MSYDWAEIRIDAPRYRSGNVKLTCPECSADRKNRRDRCLSVNLSTGMYLCHHCGWAGKAKEHGAYMPTPETKRKTYKRPKYEPGPNPQDRVIAWFQARGISEATVRRHRIEARKVRFEDSPNPDKLDWAIAFPHIRKGEILNVQYRTADKRFRSETGCEMALYGLDDIREGEPLIFTEGQMDKLALEEAGYTNAVSLPNGASIGRGEFLESAEAELAAPSQFILAGDNDAAGIAAMDELARRLGPERCARVEWPEGCKDANDVLMKHGRESLIEAIECARPLPISGIVKMSELLPEIEDLWRSGVQSGEDPGWAALRPYYRPRAGEWTMVTGAPGMGKSAVIDALMMNLAMRSDWRFAMYSPEQAPLKRHAVSLLKLWRGLPFDPGPHARMELQDVRDGAAFLDEYFTFLQPEEEDLSVDGILKLARACVLRYGIRGFVIDPWNEVEHHRPASLTETEYISQSLSKIRRFARMNDVHVWLMVHPVKLQKQQDGSYPVATPYDAAGSAHWFNKADMIFSVWRDKTNDFAPVEIHVQKVRFRENGKLGVAHLRYVPMTGELIDNADYGINGEIYAGHTDTE